MEKSRRKGFLIFVFTIFLTTYENVAQTFGTAPQETQTNQSVQDEKIVLDNLNQLTQDFFAPEFPKLLFEASNSSGVEITDEMMKNYLSAMIDSPKAQQKIRAADGDEMFEAFSEAKIPDTIVGVYERHQNGRYRHVCSGAVINYFHVITAASCLWNESTSNEKDPSSFLIVAGRTAYPEEINDVNLKEGEQRFNVSHFLVPRTFTSTAGNSQGDLAVVRLASVVEKTNNVNFVHVDWANDFSEELNNGVQIELFVDPYNSIEDSIRYVNVTACVDPENGVNTTSSDKRCARFTGPTVSFVNFGAPLFVYHPDTRRHYLRGVMSWTHSEHGTRVVEFTHISDEKTLRWINKAATGLYDPPANYKETSTGFYSYYNRDKTWQEAKAFCESNGNYSYLAFPTKEAEYYIIMSQAFLPEGRMRPTWVGFSDREKEGDVVSLFGKNVDSYEYANWLNIGNVTKNEDESDCVFLDTFGDEALLVLVTSSCDERRPFICGFCLECALLDSAFGETRGVSRYMVHSTVV